MKTRDKKMPKKHRGAFHELIAVCYLLAEGYDVFHNVSPHGLIDMVAIRGDELLKLDVKALERRQGKGADYIPCGTLSEAQILAGVKVLVVRPDETCFIGDPEKRRESPTCATCGNPIPRSSIKRFCSKQCRPSSSKRYVKANRYKPSRHLLTRPQSLAKYRQPISLDEATGAISPSFDAVSTPQRSPPALAAGDDVN